MQFFWFRSFVAYEKGCKFRGRVYPNGDEWHPTVQPFGEVKCVKCRCKVWLIDVWPDVQSFKSYDNKYCVIGFGIKSSVCFRISHCFHCFHCCCCQSSAKDCRRHRLAPSTATRLHQSSCLVLNKQNIYRIFSIYFDRKRSQWAVDWQSSCISWWLTVIVVAVKLRSSVS